MHIFPFSKRQNTFASKMVNQCASTIKSERVHELNALNSKKRKKYMLSQLYKTLEVIIEEKGSEKFSIGTSSNYLKVKINSNEYPQRTLVRVKAAEIEENLIRGNLIDKI